MPLHRHQERLPGEHTAAVFRLRSPVEALSKQLSTLESAGYVEIRKGFVGKRPRTSASLSAAGRQAFEQHVAALQRIIARSQQDAGAGPAAEAGRGIPGR